MPSGTPEGLQYRGCIITKRIERDGMCSGVIIFPDKDKKFIPKCKTEKAMHERAKALIRDTLSCVEMSNKFLSMKLV